MADPASSRRSNDLMHASCMLCGRTDVPGAVCRACHVPIPSAADELQLVRPPACPRCRLAMQPVTISTSQQAFAHVCLACHGMFVPPRAWHILLTHPDRVARLLAKLERGTPGHRELGATKFENVPCPGCSREMERLRFAGDSDVVMDVCLHRHGAWLDAGELATVERFLRHRDHVGTRAVKLEAVHREQHAPNKQMRRLAEAQVEMIVRHRLGSAAPPPMAPPWWRTRTAGIVVAVAIAVTNLIAFKYMRSAGALRDSQRMAGEALPAAAGALGGNSAP